MKEYTNIQKGSGLETRVYQSMRAYFEDEGDAEFDIIQIEGGDYKHNTYINIVRTFFTDNKSAEQITTGIAAAIVFLGHTPHAIDNVTALTTALIKNSNEEHNNEKYIKQLVDAINSVLNDKKLPEERKERLKNSVNKHEILKQALQEANPPKRKLTDLTAANILPRKRTRTVAPQDDSNKSNKQTLAGTRGGFFSKAARNIRNAFTRPRSKSAPARLETPANDSDIKPESVNNEDQVQNTSYEPDTPRIRYEIRQMLYEVEAIADDEAINSDFDIIKDSYLDFSQLIDAERQKMQDSGMTDSKITTELIKQITDAIVNPLNGQAAYPYDELVRFCHFGLKNLSADNSNNNVANADILAQAINQAKESRMLNTEAQELLENSLDNPDYRNITMRNNEIAATKPGKSPRNETKAARAFLKESSRAHKNNTQKMMQEMSNDPSPQIDAWVGEMKHIQQTDEFKKSLQHYQETKSSADAHRLANLTGLRQECEKIRRRYHKALAFTPASRLPVELSNIASSARNITTLYEQHLKGKIPELDEVLENELSDIGNLPKKIEKYKDGTAPSRLRRTRHAAVYSALKIKKHGKEPTEQLRETTKPMRQRAATWLATKRPDTPKPESEEPGSTNKPK